MFEQLGHIVFRRRRAVLAATAVFLAVALGWGTSVFGSLVGGGFDDPQSDSFRAAQLLDDRLGRDDADVVVLYSSDALTVDDPAFREAVTSTLAGLPPSDVSGAATFFSTQSPSFVGADRRSTFAALQLVGADDEAREAAYERIVDDLDAPGLTTQVGGRTPTFATISETISADIARAEMLSFPVLLVLLVVVFGSLVAASMPLAIGFLAVLGAITGLRVLTELTDISIFAINIVTLLGLGLAIDYALFVVSRFREELARDPDVRTALGRTLATAGRTVAFSGLTVAIALSTLLIFPQVFLRSMGLGGMFAVLVAMLGALTVLPALLAVLGHRINALSFGPLQRRLARPVELDRGRWARIATSVMRRPVVWVAGIVVLLLAMGSPFLRVEFGNADATALPAGTEVRVVQEALERDFPGGTTTPIEVAVTGAADASAVEQYAGALAGLPGVTVVQPRGSDGDVTGLTVLSDPPPQSAAAKHLVEAVRELPAPAGAQVLVGGESAITVDLLDSLRTLVPQMLLLMVGVTFVLLFLAFGSVVLPLKASLLNLLSLSASFGAVVWIFQDGNLAGLLGITPGPIEATQPLLMLAIAFGLSMDYEVFLLSRIKEEHDRTGDTVSAVARGVQRTGGLITSAALLLVVVIGAFSTSDVQFIKMIGVGLAIAIVVDATVVRGLLVPAAMRLMGEVNWWAPAPLRRLHDRIGMSETEPAAPPVRPRGKRVAEPVG
jgi:RND superfamily putative drug exporter